MNTMKSIIKNMRDKGMTFQEIADKLDSDYNIKRSRQAVHGLYTRAVDSNIASLSEEEMQLTCQIVNVYCLGYNMTQTSAILNHRGVEVSYPKVNRVIKDNVNYTRSVNEAMINTLKMNILIEPDPAILRAMLSFEGVPITDKKFCVLVEEVTKQAIKEYAVNKIATAYKITGERGTVKRLCEGLPDITISDIEISLRP